MGVTVEFDDFDRAFEEEFENVKNAVKERFMFEGEKAVAKARRDGNYQDRSGNLRNGIGYAVTDDGIDSVSASPKTARFIEEQDVSGISLVLADGEEYGTYVEAIGYNVLSGAKLEAEENLKKAFNAGN